MEKDVKEAIYIWLLLLIAICVVDKCSAQTKTIAVYDTICIRAQQVEKLTKPNEKGSCQAVVNFDGKTKELVNVSKSVREYILMCKEENIEPNLAIKLRNGIVSSLIRFRPKFKKR